MTPDDVRIAIRLGLTVVTLALYLRGLKKIRVEHSLRIKWVLEYQLKRPINLGPYIETIFWAVFFLMLAFVGAH